MPEQFLLTKCLHKRELKILYWVPNTRSFIVISPRLFLCIHEKWQALFRLCPDSRCDINLSFFRTVKQKDYFLVAIPGQNSENESNDNGDSQSIFFIRNVFTFLQNLILYIIIFLVLDTMTHRSFDRSLNAQH